MKLWLTTNINLDEMKMKLPIISSIFSSWAKINENVVVFATVVHGSLDTMWDLIQLELQL
jgi:hypothetical protein